MGVTPGQVCFPMGPLWTDCLLSVSLSGPVGLEWGPRVGGGIYREWLPTAGTQAMPRAMGNLLETTTGKMERIKMLQDAKYNQMSSQGNFLFTILFFNLDGQHTRNVLLRDDSLNSLFIDLCTSCIYYTLRIFKKNTKTKDQEEELEEEKVCHS